MSNERYVRFGERRLGARDELVNNRRATRTLSDSGLADEAVTDQISLPQGDLSNGANVGWNALGSLVLSAPMQPLGIRADVAYNQFGFKPATQALVGASGSQRVGSLTLNGTYRIPTPGTPISPSLIAGLGAYRMDCSVSAACGSVTHFGWNVGLSMKLYTLGFRSFVEARYHRTSADDSAINYFPITIGLLF